jgi:hypothetical protein
LIGRSVGHRQVTRMSCCLFSFVTRTCPSRPFYALRATPKTALNFDRSVGRSQESHTNVTLPLQFLHPGLPFPTLLRPAGHPQNSFKFWSVGWSIGHMEVTRTSLCLFSFVTWARPSRPFYALQATPKTALNFGWLVGWSVGHREVTRTSCCLFSFGTQARPSRPFYTLRATPKRPLILVSWSVGRSVGRSQGSHMNVMLPIQFHHQGLPFPTLLRPARHPQNDLKFWSSGQSVGWSVMGKSHE